MLRTSCSMLRVVIAANLAKSESKVRLGAKCWGRGAWHNITGEVPSPNTAKRCHEFAEIRPGFDARQIDSRPCCKRSRRRLHQKIYSMRCRKCAGGAMAVPRTEFQFNSRPYWQSQETTQTPCGGDYRGGLLRRRRISHALRPQRGRRIGTSLRLPTRALVTRCETGGGSWG